VSSDEHLFRGLRLTIPTANERNVIRKLGADIAYAPPKLPVTSLRKRLSKQVHASAKRWHLPTRLVRDCTFAEMAHKCAFLFKGLTYRPVVRYGLLPACLYGTELAPLDAGEAARMATAVYRADNIWSPGLPSDVAAIFIGPRADPLHLARSRFVGRLAREVWLTRADASSREAHPDRLTPAELLILGRRLNEHIVLPRLGTRVYAGVRPPCPDTRHLVHT
jgi:hypothetical protein